MQHTATCCNTQQQSMQHTATHCNTMQHTMQHTRSHHKHVQKDITRDLQHTATHCNTHCNTLQHTDSPQICPKRYHKRSATHCNTLQHTVTHCNTDCNTLQHMESPHISPERCTLHLTFSNKRCCYKYVPSDMKREVHISKRDQCRLVPHTATYCNLLQHTLRHTATHCNAETCVNS